METAVVLNLLPVACSLVMHLHQLHFLVPCNCSSTFLRASFGLFVFTPCRSSSRVLVSCLFYDVEPLEF